MLCTCGAKNETDSVYCEMCGKPLEEGDVHKERPWLTKECRECGKRYPGSVVFCDACGKPLHLAFEQKKGILMLSDSSGRRITYEGGSREFGRQDFKEWLSADKKDLVSRRHFKITVEGDNYVIEHLSKQNPTRLNGRDVVGKQALKDGDVIDVSGGTLKLFVSIQE